ncbi:putative tyrosinase-like protein tyr-3 isoform X2 [Ruditapes philippinarum]|nr:putative tyrosinase-like protein tyr-3 isoform X2 [Ruditapes philippinarum]XP_060569900.1 putative tyrosinase-like protein tyr-3 isoform X2 [Ruditapes philippinarum]XP_060569901.1 putative tyrosinase-like protein tyr-3 isoform X2 [Ruditapes philippinarum]XP_060569902.1 putative tyrosinase-like protein tyr-3 isoform X2 [Ruditapes philippinarum]
MMFNYNVRLLLAFVVANYIQAYQFNINLPDSAQSEIEACVNRSRKSPAIQWQAEMACGHEYFARLGPNNLTEDDWAIFKTATDNIFGHTPPSFGISTRREVRTLSEEEWQNVTDVFGELFKAGVLQSFARLHGKAKLRAHKGGAFLPWHRVFLAHFEQEMKKINPSVSLPYWDYTTDYEIPQPYESVLWTPCFFGENNDTVLSGPFKFMYGAHGAIISRRLAENFYSTRLINKADIERLKDFCGYKDITTGAVKEETDHNLETLHDSVHDYIGGDMGVVENSAYDPIFWFHHAFIDYIWESFREHQTAKCTEIDIESDYRPINDTGWVNIIKQGPEDSMFGYSHLKTKDGLWRNWTDVFYTYEPQPACGGTCTGEYLYCDNKNRCLSRTKEACKKHLQTRNAREVGARDPLVPQIPCESGTPLRGLKGDGRTMETSQAECENILENERDGSIHGGLKQGETKYSCTALERFIYVLIGSLVCVIVSVTTVKIMRLRKQLKHARYDNVD